MSEKLTKFPVTAPDGTEYRVTIKEKEKGTDEFVHVRLYQRSRFGFKRLYCANYGFYTSGLYWRDYVAVAKRVVLDYQFDIALNPNIKRRLTSAQRSAIKRRRKFAEWDGRVTEEESE